MLAQLRPAKMSSNEKASFEIVKWEDDPKKRKMFKAEFEKLKQHYRILRSIVHHDCPESFDKLRLTHNNSKDAFDQKVLIISINEKFDKIMEHQSHIDSLLISEINSSGKYNIFSPTGLECWESAAWDIRKDIQDLGEMSLSLLEDMIKFIKKAKEISFPKDVHELSRSKQQIAYLSANPP